MAFIAIVLVLGCNIRAAATLRVSSDNGVTWTNIVDNSPTDAATNTGTISFFPDQIGLRGSFTAATDRSQSLVTLACLVVFSAGPLIVQYSDNDFVAGYGFFDSEVGGNSSDLALVTFKTYMDPANTLFSGTNLMNSGPMSVTFAKGTNSQPVTLNLFSLTAELVITNAGGTQVNGTVQFVSPMSPTLQPDISGDTVHLSFQTQAVFTYVLEYKNSLADTEWTPLQSIDGTDSMVTVDDSTSGGQTRFYRVSVH